MREISGRIRSRERELCFTEMGVSILDSGSTTSDMEVARSMTVKVCSANLVSGLSINI